jgi:hypothetical protein
MLRASQGAETELGFLDALDPYPQHRSCSQRCSCSPHRSYRQHRSGKQDRSSSQNAASAARSDAWLRR